MRSAELINPSTGHGFPDGRTPTSAEETDDAIERLEGRVRQLASGGSPEIGPGCCAGSPRVVDAHVDELAAIEVGNSGHTIGNARWEAGNVRDVLDYYAGAPERLTGQQIPVPGGVDMTFHEPLGVVGVIVPWNFPMPIAGWGFAPALAAGNTVVLKPAEMTPLTALRLAELALEAGAARATSSRSCPAGARWSGAVRDPPVASARSASPVRPRSASRSWPAARTR